MIQEIVIPGHHRGCGDDALERWVLTQNCHGAWIRYLPCDQAFQSPFWPNIEWLLLWAQGQTSMQSSENGQIHFGQEKHHKVLILGNAVVMTSLTIRRPLVVIFIIAGGIGTPFMRMDSTTAWKRKPIKYWWRIQLGKNGNQSMLSAIVC